MAKIAVDGRITDETARTINPLDRGLLYGDGLFETLRLKGSTPLFAERHWARLTSSCGALDFPSVGDSEPVVKLIKQLAEENDHLDGSARVTVTRGVLMSGPRPTGDEKPTVIVRTLPRRPGVDEARMLGLKGVFLKRPMRAEGLYLQGHKTLSYLSSILALNEAEPGVEPILETVSGNLSEGATSNLFWAAGGRLHTPSDLAGCLPGIARELVLEIAGDLGVEVEIGLYPRESLLKADEAFITNSLYSVAPLVRAGSRPIGSGAPGELTLTLQRVLDALTDTYIGGGTP